jgi:hypothetical protein
MGKYNREQWEALRMVQHDLEGLPGSKVERLRASVEPYESFKRTEATHGRT